MAVIGRRDEPSLALRSGVSASMCEQFGSALVLGVKGALICSIYWFPWYQYSYHGWFQDTNVKSTGSQNPRKEIASHAMGQRQEWDKNKGRLVASMCSLALALHIWEVSQYHHSCIKQDVALVTTDGGYEHGDHKGGPFLPHSIPCRRQYSWLPTQ